MASSPRRFVLQKDEFPNLALMMLVTLDALRALGGSATIQELVDQVIDQERVTEDEQGWLMPNGRDYRLKYYLAWSRTYLKRGGALENSSRGVWALTEQGEATTTSVQTQLIYDRVAKEERQRAKQKRDSNESGVKSEASSISDHSIIGDDNDDDWQSELLSALMDIKADAFERLAQRLLREAGFLKVEVRGKTGDGGIDGVGILRVNLITFQVYFQCKRWSNSVGAKDIRDFRGALQGRATKGLFITTSSFTKQASEEATRDGAIAIDLIDGDRLCELMKEFQLGVKTKTVEQVTVQSERIAEL